MIRNNEHKVLMALRGILAAVALSVTAWSCQNDVLVDVTDEGIGQTEYAIDFSSGYVDSRVQTKADPIKLEQYNTTMGVWGWRSDSETTDELTFKNQLVSYDATQQEWTYSPLKYWVKGSNYRFYAYSPQTEKAGIDPETGMISISDITADGTDWMIARAGTSIADAHYGQPVDFIMQHLLFNKVVRAKVSGSLAADNDISKVVIENLTVGDFISKGDFTQKLNHTPDVDNAQDCAVQEWTLDEIAPTQRFTFSGTQALTTTYVTLFDALCIPQPMTDDMTLTVKYALEYGNGRVERFIYSDTLKNIFAAMSFDRFLGGNSYIISLIIGADAITFDAGADKWTDYTESGSRIN